MTALIYQDVDAIIEALRADSVLSEVCNAVGHLNVEDGTLPPYVIVFDIAAVNIEAFRNTMVAVDGSYAIRCVSRDDEVHSAQKHAQLVQQAVHDALHGRPIAIADFAMLNLRVGPREISHWENISDQVRYLWTGFKWLATMAPVT